MPRAGALAHTRALQGTRHVNALKKMIVFAEEQIVYGRNLSDAMAARDRLRRKDPGAPSLQGVNATIGRMLSAEAAPIAPVRPRAGGEALGDGENPYLGR